MLNVPAKKAIWVRTIRRTVSSGRFGCSGRHHKNFIASTVGDKPNLSLGTLHLLGGQSAAISRGIRFAAPYEKRDV
jgi:hypothetical protein